MIDLAEHNTGEFIPLKEAPDGDGFRKISESIIAALAKRIS